VERQPGAIVVFPMECSEEAEIEWVECGMEEEAAQAAAEGVGVVARGAEESKEDTALNGGEAAIEDGEFDAQCAGLILSGAELVEERCELRFRAGGGRAG
jgi:hypothetical protein